MKKTIVLMSKVALAALVLMLTLGASCITTGNVVVVEYIGDMVGQTDTHFEKAEVNLKDNPDWRDHKDKLNSVDDIGFACKIYNDTNVTATGQVYISQKQYTEISDLRTRPDVYKILDGIIVAPHTTKEIKWEDSYGYLSNFDNAKTIVYDESEVFYLYFVAKETPFKINVTNIVLFLSVNGKA